MSTDQNGADSASLEQQAIDWLVRLRSDDLGDEDSKAFAEWLVQDYRHGEAFAYAEDLFDDMVFAAGNHAELTAITAAEQPASETVAPVVVLSDRAIRGRRFKTRRYRPWMWGLSAVAAVWLFAVVLVLPDRSHPFDGLTSDYYTGTGELSDIRLADGSRILLNTNSAVSINFNDTNRQIVLHHGQARFSVAEDIQRPFDVSVDDVNVRALGTVFEVYRANTDEMRVTVQEHSVAVGLADDGADRNEDARTVLLTVGQRLSYRYDGDFSQVESVALDQASSWQQRRLVINDQPLGELIDELNRYRVGRIYVSDAELSAMHVTGVFSLEHPDQILDSLCKVLGLRETKVAGLWVVLHR